MSSMDDWGQTLFLFLSYPGEKGLLLVSLYPGLREAPLRDCLKRNAIQVFFKGELLPHSLRRGGNKR